MKVVILLFILILQDSWSHGGKKHKKRRLGKSETDVSKAPDAKNLKSYERINANYLKKIKPIFNKSCFDCHSNQTVYPWYYKIPGIKQLMDSDTVEAKSHLDFSADFPFVGHETPDKDLKSILKSINNKKMPPKKYLWLHRDKKLTKNEIKEVNDWVNNSLETMK